MLFVFVNECDTYHIRKILGYSVCDPKISLPTSFTLQNVKSTPIKVLIDLIRHMRNARWKADFDTFESTTTFLSSVWLYFL